MASVDEREPLLPNQADDDAERVEQGRSSNAQGFVPSFFRSFRSGRQDSSAIESRWCPEESAGWLSHLTFSYITGLIKLGLTKHLEFGDLWSLPQHLDGAHVADFLQQKLTATVSEKKPQGSLRAALFNAYGLSFWSAGLIKLFHDSCAFVQPVILQQVLSHLGAADSDELHTTSDDPGAKQRRSIWLGVDLGNPRVVGLLWTLLLFAAAVLQTLLINRYFIILNRISLYIKTGLISTLYRKALRISSAAKTELGVGKVVNHVSNDATIVFRVVEYLHILWSGPLQIGVYLALLTQILGPLPSLVAVGVTLCVIPLSALSGFIESKLQARVLQRTDARVKVVSEVVSGIKAIKLYAWEDPYVDKVKALRQAELRVIRLELVFGMLNFLAFSVGPIFIAVGAFGMYIWQGNDLTADVAFPSLVLLNNMQFPIFVLPWQILAAIQANVSMGRLQKLMETDENEGLPPVVPNPETRHLVHVEDATFSWSPTSTPFLQNISLRSNGSQLVVVVGAVGCGKSSLLAALLGEMHTVSGTVTMPGKVAYTAQDPWIQNLSLRDNILMGERFNAGKYAAVIEACALQADLDLLPAGDATEIGEKGVNLSGGQKHRVALARACYATADVYLLDDPLSAVDAHVGRHIFDHAIRGLLSDSACILVTHQMQYVPKADYVVIVENGKISKQGTYPDLVSSGVDFNMYHARQEGSKEEAEENGGVDGGGEPAVETAAHGKATWEGIEGEGRDVRASLESRKSTKEEIEIAKAAAKADKGKLVEAEERAVGSVRKVVYYKYLQTWGPCLLLPILMLLLATIDRAVPSLQQYWMSWWTDAASRILQKAEDEGVAMTREEALAQVDQMWYLKVYAVLGFTSVGMSLLKELVLIVGTINSAWKLHNQLLAKLVRLPMSFFDSQPSGRILNRFTKDIAVVDQDLQWSFSAATLSTLLTVFALILVSIVAPYILFFVPFLFIAYRNTQRLYVTTSRELKRLDSLAYSPIFSNFGEIVSGIVTVRAFRKQGAFFAGNLRTLNHSNRVAWPIVVANRWLSVRLELLSSVIVLAAAVLVTTAFPKEPGLAGLAISSALSLTGLITWMIRETTQLEVNMNAVERLLEYIPLPEEAPAVVPANRPPDTWPALGRMQVTNLWLRYRPELDHVLKGVSFTVEGGHKLGVCGRTGSGKSTLMMAIYRIVEPSSGRIEIDGVNIGSIGLKDLRSRLSLVPQDPVVFSGTVKVNLDPFGLVGHEGQYWRVLEQTGLKAGIEEMEGGLNAQITEGGSNLSVGQKQLLCMSRALLRNTRVLILDEATSNVDNVTDSLIQSTIRSAFRQCTVLTIAHRIHTIMDSDKILLLDAGRVQEFDSPNTLQRNPASAFAKLVQEAGAATSSG